MLSAGNNQRRCHQREKRASGNEIRAIIRRPRQRRLKKAYFPLFFHAFKLDSLLLWRSLSSDGGTRRRKRRKKWAEEEEKTEFGRPLRVLRE